MAAWVTCTYEILLSIIYYVKTNSSMYVDSIFPLDLWSMKSLIWALPYDNSNLQVSYFKLVNQYLLSG